MNPNSTPHSTARRTATGKLVCHRRNGSVWKYHE